MDWFYRLSYLAGKVPWDSGVPPPELVEVVDGPPATRPGRALDLGCGSGTNVVYLSQRGWDVTGVDLVGGAIARARSRAASASVEPRLVRGDVTRLPELGLAPGFDLLFDLGCYHGIPADRRDAYAAGTTRLAAPGALLLLYGFAPGEWGRGPFRIGVTGAELRRRFGTWELVEERRGTGRFESCWYALRATGRPRLAQPS
jgi:SAM-dependent methyltransferase